MKILVGTFITESNERNPNKNEITTYSIAFGDDCINKMEIGDIFTSKGIEIIPSIYAVSGASGVCKKHTFDYIEDCFAEACKEHINEIDGMFLMLHGASEVDGGIGSGDHHILKTIREIVGPYIPICVACDPHGNLCEEYVNNTTLIRSYRESPHTDALATKRLVCEKLCELLQQRQNIHPAYRKLPLILGGEQSVSTDEPVKSINQYMNEMEKDPRINSASWHVGYLRHDSDVAGCGVVVVPQTAADQQYAEEKCDELAKYVWDKRHEFHYTGHTADPETALRECLEFDGGLSVLTDSGDNTSSGAPGYNTYVLRQALAANPSKKVLFASICDQPTYDSLAEVEIGGTAHVELGVGINELSTPVPMDVTILSRGEVVRPLGVGSESGYSVFGAAAVCHINGTNIDVVIANHRQYYAYPINYKLAGIDVNDYDVIVVKLGYIFPYLKSIAKFYVMSLTDGATPQDTKRIPFKRIMRPMYPIDEI